MKTSLYAIRSINDIQGMAQTVAQMLTNEEKMECQILTTPLGGKVVQAREPGGQAKQFIGMDRAITIQIDPLTNGAAEVRIGHGEWLKKSGTMLISMFVLWPLTITSGIGMWKQGRLPGKIDRAIQMYLAGIAGAVATDPNTAAA